MYSVDPRELIETELQNPTQRFFSGSNSHETTLGKVYATKFERTDELIYGKAKNWNRIQFEIDSED